MTRQSDHRDQADPGESGGDQPGLSALREVIENVAGGRGPGRPKLREDGVAGLTTAINNVPDGMANGFLVGVNPVYGLYATMAGPFVGGIVSSTQLMVITTTAAASLTASEALDRVPAESRADAMILLVILVGIVLAALGLLGLGRLIRFVSFSVTTGFLSGVAVQLMLSQLPTITGYEAAGENRVSQTLDLLAHTGQIDLTVLAIGLLTGLLAVALPHTPVGNFGRLVAIVVPSVIVVLFDLDQVQTVRDVGDIPSGLPTPVVPSLSAISADVITGALAVALVIFVQGAGVSQSVPNPDGSRRSTSRDLIAQGAANVASGLIRGLPVGGSLSATALGVISGARTRWAAIFAGVWMAVIVLALTGLVSYVAMPSLGALLVIAGASSIKPSNLRTVWRAGWAARLAAGATFLSMLFLPIQVAVGIGVALSALLYVIRSSTEITLVQVVERPDGRIEERETPTRLPSNAVTVLDVYGPLFFAAARQLERLLPDPADARNPGVVLRLRGRTEVGATLIEVLANYAEKLRKAGGRLYISGIGDEAYRRIAQSRELRLAGPVRVHRATSVVGESTREAIADARAWLVDVADRASTDDRPPDGERE